MRMKILWSLRSKKAPKKHWHACKVLRALHITLHMCTIRLIRFSMLAGGRNSSGTANGSSTRERPSRTDFRRAYLEWLKRQGDSAERSRQFYGDSELDLFLLWTRVAQHGGLKAVSAVPLSLSWS